MGHQPGVTVGSFERLVPALVLIKVKDDVGRSAVDYMLGQK